MIHTYKIYRSTNRMKFTRTTVEWNIEPQADHEPSVAILFRFYSLLRLLLWTAWFLELCVILVINTEIINILWRMEIYLSLSHVYTVQIIKINKNKLKKSKFTRFMTLKTLVTITWIIWALNTMYKLNCLNSFTIVFHKVIFFLMPINKKPM